VLHWLSLRGTTLAAARTGRANTRAEKARENILSLLRSLRAAWLEELKFVRLRVSLEIWLSFIAILSRPLLHSHQHSLGMIPLKKFRQTLTRKSGIGCDRLNNIIKRAAMEHFPPVWLVNSLHCGWPRWKTACSTGRCIPTTLVERVPFPWRSR
jgi:hypothetical protein